VRRAAAVAALVGALLAGCAPWSSDRRACLALAEDPGWGAFGRGGAGGQIVSGAQADDCMARRGWRRTGDGAWTR